MATADVSSQNGTRSAPHARMLSVPQAPVVSIEHPGLIRNFDNGFKSLGGEAQLRGVSNTQRHVNCQVSRLIYQGIRP